MAGGMIRGQKAWYERLEFCRGCAAQFFELCRVAARNFLFLVFCLLLPVFCYAEQLLDPTRPPAIIDTFVARAEGDQAGDMAPGLQSIIISKNRRAAIIDGENIELGGKHGDAKLIEVNEGNVVLQGAQGRQVLALFPDVQMTRKEIEAKPQLPISKAQAGKHKTRPLVHKEKK